MQLLPLALVLAEPRSVMEDLDDAKAGLAELDQGDLQPLASLISKAEANEPPGAKMYYHLGMVPNGDHFVPETGASSLLDETPPQEQAKIDGAQAKLRAVGDQIRGQFADIDKIGAKLATEAQSLEVKHPHSHSHTHPHGRAHGHNAHGHTAHHHAHKAKVQAAHEASHHASEASLLEVPDAKMKARISEEDKNIQRMMAKLDKTWKDDGITETAQPAHGQPSASSFLETAQKPAKTVEWFNVAKHDAFDEQERLLGGDEARLAHLAGRMRHAHKAIDGDLAAARAAMKDHKQSKFFQPLKDILAGKAEPEHLRLHVDD